jgi:hypothetical protein
VRDELNKSVGVAIKTRQRLRLGIFGQRTMLYSILEME